MEKQTLLIIGLIGGILAVVGVFLPWMILGHLGGGTRNVSGWDLRTFRTFPYSPYLTLIGGVIAMLGSFALLKGKRFVGFLLPIGGAIAIFGGVMAYFDVRAILFGGWIPEIFPDWGYGFYVCIVGGVLALIGGTLSLKAK